MTYQQTETRRRSFGVEVEFAGDKQRAIQSMRDHGLIVAGDNSGHYYNPHPNEFAVVMDETVPDGHGMNRAKHSCELRRAWESGAASSILREHRYRGINLQKFCSHQTVEFRIFNSSVNPDRVLAYVALCVGTIQDGIFCKRVVSKTF